MDEDNLRWCCDPDGCKMQQAAIASSTKPASSQTGNGDLEIGNLDQVVNRG